MQDTEHDVKLEIVWLYLLYVHVQYIKIYDHYCRFLTLAAATRRVKLCRVVAVNRSKQFMTARSPTERRSGMLNGVMCPSGRRRPINCHSK